jgi:uncharacterized protein
MNGMNTKQEIENDLKTAMRSGDTQKKSTLRMVLASIKLAEIDKTTPLDESEVNAILQKEIKSRRETITDAERAERPDLAVEARAEIDIISKYLPQQLSSDEIEVLAKEAISKAGATSPKEMGAVMKLLMPQVQGRADGSQVSQIVRRLLE